MKFGFLVVYTNVYKVYQIQFVSQQLQSNCDLGLINQTNIKSA
jgi:hypothetical protein